MSQDEVFAADPRLAELLALHALRLLEPRILRRLDDLLRRNPPDTLDRLEVAAKWLNITGDNADALIDEAIERTTNAKPPE